MLFLQLEHIAYYMKVKTIKADIYTKRVAWFKKEEIELELENFNTQG